MPDVFVGDAKPAVPKETEGEPPTRAGNREEALNRLIGGLEFLNRETLPLVRPLLIQLAERLEVTPAMRKNVIGGLKFMDPGNCHVITQSLLAQLSSSARAAPK
jgi:hypothetical protein